MTVIVPTDWASIMTAVGTVAVAVVAVAVALFGEWRTGVRVRDEREHAATVLADERKAADDRLERQLAHSDAQLAAERSAADARLKSQMEHSDAQLREQRERAKDAEQLTEAWSVEVIGARTQGEAGLTSSDPKDPPERPVVIVTNRGRFTITQVDARFSFDGRGLNPRLLTQPFVDFSELPFQLGHDLTGAIGEVYLGVLAPGAGMRLLGATVVVSRLRTTYAIVRWTDHWGQRWERKHGQVTEVSQDQDWAP